MIDITDYTTYADVRAVLGLDDIELPDATLDISTYASVLQRTLRGTTDSAGKTLFAYFDELDAKGTLTDEEDTLFGLIKEFSTYTVAISCLPGLSLLVKKTESDGKATATRFSAESTFKDVGVNVTNQWTDIRNAIFEALDVSIEYNAIKAFTRVPPETDIVTNS